jgi:hypothetical protein
MHTKPITILLTLALISVLGYSNTKDWKALLSPQSSHKQEKTGTLIIKLSTKVQRKNITSGSPINSIKPDMDIASYDITGVGPGRTGFSTSAITDQTGSVSDIACGAWSIGIIAKNSDCNVLGSGTVNSRIPWSSTSTAG